MDYSLLLKKINLNEDLRNEIQTNPQMKFYNKYLFYSNDLNYAYTCIIIDYFQDYNILKKMERFGKTFIKPFSNELITCVPANTYSERFINFFNNKVYNSEVIKNITIIETTNNSIQNSI